MTLLSTLAERIKCTGLTAARKPSSFWHMSSGFSEIEKEAQKLSAAERERLAQNLFESVHRKELTEVDEAWLAVAEERMNAYRAGQDQGMSEADFFDRVQNDLGWK